MLVVIAMTAWLISLIGLGVAFLVFLIWRSTVADKNEWRDNPQAVALRALNGSGHRLEVAWDFLVTKLDWSVEGRTRLMDIVLRMRGYVHSRPVPCQFSKQELRLMQLVQQCIEKYYSVWAEMHEDHSRDKFKELMATQFILELLDTTRHEHLESTLDTMMTSDQRPLDW